MAERVRGVVLREIFAGESDKRLVVLTLEHGKMLLYAKGARQAKSKLLAGSSVFCCADFYVFNGRGFNSVTRIDLIESFYSVRENLSALSYGCYFAEVLERTVLEDMDTKKLLRLFLLSLTALSKGFESQFVSRAFEIKYLQLSGVLSKGDPRLNILSKGARMAVVYILSCSEERLFSFRLSLDVYEEMRMFCKEAMEEYTEQHFKTLEFAESLSL